MNHDEVLLAVKNARVEKFVSYTVTSDLFDPDGSFEMTFYPGYDIKKGDACEIYVNRRVELVGIITSVKRSTSRSGRTMTVSGKSIAWLLSASCVTKFATLPVTLKDIVERLVRPIPFIGKKDFEYRGKSAKASVNRKFVELSPGDTVFDVIKKAANSQGYIFYAASNGTFVFDNVPERGDNKFKIGGHGEFNYIEGSVDNTIEDCHSDIIVMGESQDDDDVKYVKASIQNKDFPFKMPFVVSWNENEGPAKKTAELRLAVEKSQAVQLEYTMQGHSQNGKNWEINAFAQVEDPSNGIEGRYLIKSRTFSLDRDNGKTTHLSLQLGGSL